MALSSAVVSLSGRGSGEAQTSSDRWMACEHCDTVYREPELATKEVSMCLRCGQVLARSGTPDAQVTFALAITALVLYALANTLPVVVVEVQGRHSSATVWQAVQALAHGYAMPAAIVLAWAMIVVPLLQIILLAWVTGFARVGQRAPAMTHAMRLLEHLRPWSMIEVFLVGALVAIVKLSSLLDVDPGAGLACLVALTLLITLLAGRSTRGLWRQVPKHSPASVATPPHVRLA